MIDKIYQGAIENLSIAKLPRWIKQLSSSYRPNRNFLDGSRIYREAIETNSEISMNWKCNKIYQEKKKERLDRCEAIELDKKEFFKERKNTKRLMQTSKLLKHRSNQHAKLSKKKITRWGFCRVGFSPFIKKSPC